MFSATSDTFLGNALQMYSQRFILKKLKLNVIFLYFFASRGRGSDDVSKKEKKMTWRQAHAAKVEMASISVDLR